jgi:hypothetical protein
VKIEDVKSPEDFDVYCVGVHKGMVEAGERPEHATIIVEAMIGTFEAGRRITEGYKLDAFLEHKERCQFVATLAARYAASPTGCTLRSYEDEDDRLKAIAEADDWCVKLANGIADALERAGCAPWKPKS